MKHRDKLKFHIRFRTIILFLLVLCCFEVFLQFAKQALIDHHTNSLPNDSSTNSDLVSSATDVIVQLLNLVLTTITTKLLGKLFDKLPVKPVILISPLNGKNNNVSGVRTISGRIEETGVCVGTKNLYCRIVYTQIKNIGKSTILECTINNQRIALALEPEQCVPLDFIVFELPNDTHKTLQGVSHIISYSIRDADGYIFSGEYKLEFNDDMTQAVFSPAKKLRRSMVEYALSDL